MIFITGENTYNTEERAKEKQKARDQDIKDLEEGKVTKEELRKRNTFISPDGGKIDWGAAKPGCLW